MLCSLPFEKDNALWPLSRAGECAKTVGKLWLRSGRDCGRRKLLISSDSFHGEHDGSVLLNVV